MHLSENAQLALDTIRGKPTRGIPQWLIHPMEHAVIDRLAGVPAGTYVQHPWETYIQMQRAIGTCMIDQYIPDNPLTMGAHGFEGEIKKGATTGAEQIVCDGMIIDSPEAVVAHMERVLFPKWERDLAALKANLPEKQNQWVRNQIENESKIQGLLAPAILKVPYGYVSFPRFSYSTYGYVNYFMAYALYPEVIEKMFALQAEHAVLQNQAVARAYREGHLPPLLRLDHDMADSRGTLVDIKSLDKIWFPYFARALEPLLKSDVKLIWHCDGNLSQMVPRLLEVGLKGFQGFQYEDGMDYEKICKMTTRDGEPLFIVAGVSVTRTLPRGTPDDVRREMKWLVENGPKTGLFLGGSSSMAPGVPWENVQTFVEGLKYYREHGRS